MGIMICKTHGRVGFVEICSHVAKQINEGKAPSGRRLSILGNQFVCDDCFNSLGFERCMSLADLPFKEALDIDDGRWEAFDVAYEAIEGRSTFYLKCIAELEHRRSSV